MLPWVTTAPRSLIIVLLMSLRITTTTVPNAKLDSILVKTMNVLKDALLHTITQIVLSILVLDVPLALLNLSV